MFAAVGGRRESEPPRLKRGPLGTPNRRWFLRAEFNFAVRQDLAPEPVRLARLKYSGAIRSESCRFVGSPAGTNWLQEA